MSKKVIFEFNRNEEKMERITRVELATFSMATRRSTTELSILTDVGAIASPTGAATRRMRCRPVRFERALMWISYGKHKRYLPPLSL